MFSIMHSWELQEIPNGHWRHLWELQESDLTSFSRIKIKVRCMRESDDVFTLTPLESLSATMRHDFTFCLLPLDILVTRECMIENIFPHLTTRQSKGDFFHAWNIKLSTKTWNQLKFSTRVISKVYCSMSLISLCQGPKPAVSAGRKKTFRCFVVGPINCHSESENFLKFLLTRANFSRFNPGDVSWIKPF